jgi:hypothetical protein
MKYESFRSLIERDHLRRPGDLFIISRECLRSGGKVEGIFLILDGMQMLSIEASTCRDGSVKVRREVDDYRFDSIVRWFKELDTEDAVENCETELLLLVRG